MKAKNKLQKASKRASETSEQTVHRQQQNREHMAGMRATKKASNVPVQQAIMAFHSDIKNLHLVHAASMHTSE